MVLAKIHSGHAYRTGTVVFRHFCSFFEQMVKIAKINGNWHKLHRLDEGISAGNVQ